VRRNLSDLGGRPEGVASELPSLGELVGQRVRAAREAAGVTLDGVARAANRRGLTTWRRNTVGELEKGRRRLTVEEFVALAVVLEDVGCRTLQPDGPALLRADDEFELGDGWTVSGSTFLALAGQQRRPELADDVYGMRPEDDGDEAKLEEDARIVDAAMTLPPADPAELKAVESLRKMAGLEGVLVRDVQLEAERLWGRRLAEERDRRLEVDAGTSPRSLQARRGHTTRALLEELARALESD
jgi:transcriptional regulator with XRE-family HTH domain